MNNYSFWLSKDNGDGTYSEVANSRIDGTIDKLSGSIYVNSTKFTFTATKGDVYRMFMQSNVANGFQIITKSVHKPLFEMVFEIDTQEYRIKTLESNVQLTKDINGKTIEKAGA